MNSRPHRHAREPAFDVGVISLATPKLGMVIDPGVARDIGDGVPLTDVGTSSKSHSFSTLQSRFASAPQRSIA